MSINMEAIRQMARDTSRASSDILSQQAAAIRKVKLLTTRAAALARINGDASATLAGKVTP